MSKPETNYLVAEEQGHLRIGELARRVGVTPAVLRTWEKRYELLTPARSPGGLRLYSERDEALLRRMRQQLEAGLSTAEAADVAKRLEDVSHRHSSWTAPDGIAGDLRAALDAFDDAAAHGVLDRLFAAYGLEMAIRAVLLPYLRELGERWADASATVVEEHFASNLIRGRLHAFARGWDHGWGPRALLACPAGELHDLPLLCFGIILRGRGWRITYLGADTPIPAIAATARAAPPTVVVLAAVTPERFSVAADGIRILARDCRVALGGAGASEALAQRLGAELLPDDVVVGAGAIAP